jgi:hypothetical protein
MTNDDSLTTPGRASRPRRVFLAAVAVLSAAGLAACTPHKVSLTHPCPAVSNRGASQLPKIGLTPKELKAQQKCG